MKITKEEIEKLARIAKISVSEGDIPILVDRLDTLLNYVSSLQKLAKDHKEHKTPQNVNVTRLDVVKETNPENILELAPQREENYFVVPMILKAD